MAQVAEQLVGRQAELSALDEALSGLEQRGSAAIELRGEPGIGKTRLLAELALRADARGQLVLSGSASELESDVPFGVFVDALDDYLRGLEPRHLDGLDEHVRIELATVFPSLASLARGREVAPQHERYRSHRAVRELLASLAKSQPLVLILDDVHWADPASVELLAALLHRLPAEPVLIAVAVRPHQVPERLSRALERAYRAETLTRAELGALTRAEARELLGDIAERAEAAGLYDESGGNPFYLDQLARSLDRGITHTPAAHGISMTGAQVPPSVAAALAEELGQLSESARRVLQGAAVVGDPFEPELAAAAAAIPEAAALDSIDELLRLDLVRSTDVPRRFRFRHPLVRRAVYESTPGGWRITAHERTAHALAALGASATARAHHVEYSARPGEMAAVAVLREAGQAAAQRAPASAARWIGAALRLLPDNAPAEERVELLLARSASLAATGQFADSHATLIESLRIVPREAEVLRVQLTTACASVENLLGQHRQAHTRLENTLAELRDPSSPEAVALMIELAANSVWRREYEAMNGQAVRALDAALVVGDRALTAAALAVRALAAAFSGATAEGRLYREQAAELIDELSDEELARRLDALVNVARAEGFLDLFEASGGHAQRALLIGRATGQGDLFSSILSVLGAALWLQGRVAESCDVLDGAIEAARLADNAHGLAWSLLYRSLSAFAAGDVELALATGEEAVQLARDVGAGNASAWATMALATALLETGNAARAAEVLLASGGPELRSIGGGWRARCLELLTRCLLACGRREEAEHAAQEAATCADAVSLPAATAMADLARAAVALDAGDAGSAAEQAVSAAATLDGIGSRFDAAMARLLAGRALVQAGHRDDAAAELQLAAVAFDSVGSIRYRDQVERELRKLGYRIHRRTRPGQTDGTGIESLTERELQVARLVADGKTNPEIAAELFLSPKTVETHLRNTFRKLNVSSRLQVARLVDRTTSSP